MMEQRRKLVFLIKPKTNEQPDGDDAARETIKWRKRRERERQERERM